MKRIFKFIFFLIILISASSIVSAQTLQKAMKKRIEETRLSKQKQKEPAKPAEIKTENITDNLTEEQEQVNPQEEWQKIKDSDSITEIENFIEAYPASQEIGEAKKRLAILKGKDFYARGRMEDAYKSFSELRAEELPEDCKKAYEASAEYHDYLYLNTSSEDALEEYIKSYPEGKYSAIVSNMLAIEKTRSFNRTTTDAQYREVYQMASDDETRELIREYIADNENYKKAMAKYERQEKRRENGGLIKLGLEYAAFDIGLDDGLMYECGIGLRVGNYTDRVQGGIALRLSCFGESGDGEEWESCVSFAGQLKLNIVPITKIMRLFAVGEFEYLCQPETPFYSYKAGLGLSWKNLETSIYYRNLCNGFDNTSSSANYIGISITSFIRLY